MVDQEKMKQALRDAMKEYNVPDVAAVMDLTGLGQSTVYDYYSGRIKKQPTPATMEAFAAWREYDGERLGLEIALSEACFLAGAAR